MDAIKSSPTIEDLSIGTGWHASAYPDAALLVRLRALRVTMISPFKHLFVSMPTCNLRLLHVRDGITGVQLLQLCRCLDKLEEMEVKILENFLPGESTTFTEMGMKNLPQLRMLVVTMCAERGLGESWSLFHHLRLPSLGSLEVTVRGSIQYQHISKIAPFLSRSSSLRSLKFWGNQPPFPGRCNHARRNATFEVAID